jgi:hypothetical protein
MAADANAGKEIQAHENTYAFFTGLMKWATILSFVVGMLVVFIIAN